MQYTYKQFITSKYSMINKFLRCNCEKKYFSIKRKTFRNKFLNVEQIYKNKIYIILNFINLYPIKEIAKSPKAIQP